MSIVVDDYVFEGPYADHDAIENRPGVFVIHCCNDGDYKVVDVGSSENLRQTLEDDSRRAMLGSRCEGTYTVAVLYSSGEKPYAPDKVEERIRRRFLVSNAARGRHPMAAKRETGAAPPE